MARLVDRDAKRRQIVEAAATQFARTGFEATLMDDVAAAAGVSKGSLYAYFANKEDLFYAVFEWLQGQLLQTSLAHMKVGGSATEQLIGFAEAGVGAFVDYVALYPVTLEVWAAAAKTGTRHRFAEAMQRLYVDYRGQVSVLFRAAQAAREIRRDIEVDVLSAVLVGAVDGLLLQYWLDPKFDPRAWVRIFLQSLFGGIAVKSGEGKS
jgi:AcrR family transcriptional regulator